MNEASAETRSVVLEGTRSPSTHAATSSCHPQAHASVQEHYTGPDAPGSPRGRAEGLLSEMRAAPADIGGSGTRSGS